jgi:hypothetical protein
MSFVRLRGKIAVALGAAVAVVLAWLLVPRRAQREELIEAAWVEERAADMRSTHVAVPLPRTFGELLEPSLAALHESYAAYKRSGPAAMNRVKRICNGQDPIAQLGPEMSVDLVQHRAAMHGALTATHARSARAPASLRLFAALRPDDAFADVQQAGRLAALDVLTLVDQGRAAEAAYECADMLALGRDLSYPSILGRMIGVAVTGASSYACGSALSLAPAGALEGVRAQLIAIRAGTPRFADLLRRERLFQQLWLADPDPRLPEGALTLIADAHAQNRNVFDGLGRALLRANARDRLAARIAAFLDAQRLDWPACAERMEEVTQRFEWNPMVRDSFVPLLRRHRDGLLKIDALVCAASVSLARARTGVLPRDPAACPPIEPEAKCGEQGASQRILEDGEGLRVSVTLSDGSDYTVPLAPIRRGSATVLVGPR